MIDNIGERIKSCRIALDLTLTDLAKKIGVSASTVRKWEIGYIKDMRSDKIQKVAEALEVTPAYLMGWEKCKNLQAESAHTTNECERQANNSSAPTRLHLNKEEKELLRIYQELSVRGRLKLLTEAINLEAEEISK